MGDRGMSTFNFIAIFRGVPAFTLLDKLLLQSLLPDLLLLPDLEDGALIGKIHVVVHLFRSWNVKILIHFSRKKSKGNAQKRRENARVRQTQKAMRECSKCYIWAWRLGGKRGAFM